MNRYVERTTKLIKIPQTRAILTLNISDLEGLLPGASFSKKDGQASATIKKTKEGIEFAAGCASLLFLVEELKTEVYHLSKENTALKTSLNEQKTITLREPSGFEWFQIWVGRILFSLSLIYILLKKYKLIK